MEHQLKRRALSAAIFAGAVIGSSCSGGASGDSSGSSPLTTIPETATLSADAGGVQVNGVDVPAGGTQPVQLDEPVVVGDQARGVLRVGDLEFLLLPKSNMRLVGWNRPAVDSWLESGQLQVTLDPNADPRLHLETSTNVVLRPLQKGTKFYACQTDPNIPKPATCLFVFTGEVEWEAKGDVKTFHAGEGTFAFHGDPASPASCPSLHDFDEWLQAALYNKTEQDLGGLVGGSPPCTAGLPSESTASSAATPAPPVPTLGGTQPATTPRRPRPPSPPPTTGSPGPPAPPEATPPTPEPTPPTPEPTPPTPEPPVDSTEPPVDSTAPTPPTPAPPVDTTQPPIP
jgi:hypothetical protein